MDNKDKIRIAAKKSNIVKKSGECCKICGENRQHLLDFHHLDPSEKEYRVSSMGDMKISKIEKEALKCILLCRTCHREEHFVEETSNKDTRAIKSILLEYKNIDSCSICGYSKNKFILHFHHLNRSDKFFAISDVVTGLQYFNKKDDIPEYIRNELDKCVVLCPNCHGDVHYDYQTFYENRGKIEEKSKNIKEINSKLDRQLVYDMHVKQNMKQIDIARHFNASKGTISDILKTFGLTRKIVHNKIDKNLLMELWEKGLTNSEISRELNESPHLVGDYLSRLNVKRNVKKKVGNIGMLLPDRRKFNPSAKELIELRETLSYSKIAKIYGVSSVAIVKRLQQLGIIPPPQKRKN